MRPTVATRKSAAVPFRKSVVANQVAAEAAGSLLFVPKLSSAIKSDRKAAPCIGIETQAFSRLIKDGAGKEVKMFDFPSDDFLGRIYFGGATSKHAVAHTRISGHGLAQLKCIRRLRALDFSEGTQLTAMLKALAGSSEMRHLAINNSHGSTLSGADCKLMAACKNLEQLEITGTKLN